MAIHHKIFFNFSVSQRQDLFRYWKDVRNHVFSIRPNPALRLEPQTNVKMGILTGIADAILHDKQKCVYEIKASVKNDWKEDAFIQAFCYAIMMGQAWFTIRLVNVFKNMQIEHVVFIDKVRHVRQRLLYDMVVWNFSCFMAKHYQERQSPFKEVWQSVWQSIGTGREEEEDKNNDDKVESIEDIMFVNVVWNDLMDTVVEIVVCRMLSPTRLHVDLITDSMNDLHDFVKTHVYKDYVFCGKAYDRIKREWVHDKVSIVHRPSLRVLYVDEESSQEEMSAMVEIVHVVKCFLTVV